MANLRADGSMLYVWPDGTSKRTVQSKIAPSTRTEEPKLYNVILLNDDYTTMEFVLQILETLFQKSPAEAFRIMMHVHRNGRGLAGVYPWEVAETKADKVAVAGERGRLPVACDYRGSLMFSTAVEVVLHIAFREAVSRRHAYLTLEHLLYALAHDPDGERILAACGADLVAAAAKRQPTAWTTRSKRFRADRSASPSRRRRSVGRCRPRCCTCRARSGRKRRSAICSRPSCSSRRRGRRSCWPSRASRGSTCSSTSRTALRRRRFISDDGGGADPGDGRDGMAGSGDLGSATAKDPLSAYCINLTARARQGLLDPLIGRAEELQRTIEVLCRRRKNNPGVRRRRRRRQDRDGRRAGDAAARLTTCRTR